MAFHDEPFFSIADLAELPMLTMKQVPTSRHTTPDKSLRLNTMCGLTWLDPSVPAKSLQPRGAGRLAVEKSNPPSSRPLAEGSKKCGSTPVGA
jgi:hypothetical protein